MFTRQAPLIAQSLWQGGLSPAQAHAITNALGQCRAPLIHRGPIQIDYTSPEMRLVTPESAKFKFPELQLPTPEILPNRPRPPEEPPEEDRPRQPNPFPPPAQPVAPVAPPQGAPGHIPQYPGYDDAWIRKALDDIRDLIKPQYLGVDDGAYINVSGNGFTEKQVIALDAEDNDLHCVFRGGQVSSNKFEAENYEARGVDSANCAELDVAEEGGRTVWKLNAAKMTGTTYVKDIWFDSGSNKINVQYEYALVFDPVDVGTDDSNLPVAPCEDAPTPIK